MKVRTAKSFLNQLVVFRLDRCISADFSFPPKINTKGTQAGEAQGESCNRSSACFLL
jgi:hypothetical protein